MLAPRIDKPPAFRQSCTVKSDFRFHHKIRVRFADTDLQGIVFNGNYLTYYDVAWTEYFREMGMTWKDIIETGADTVLARTTIEFKSPARFDEMLEVFARVSSIGKTSMTFDFEIYPEGDDRLIGAASSLYVCIDPKQLRPIRVPEELRRRISDFEGRNFDGR
jgi:acyl-CoA thioester hydrolase